MSSDRSPPASPLPPASTDVAQQAQSAIVFERTGNSMMQHGDSAPDLPSLGLNVTERKKRKHDGLNPSTASYISDMFTSFSRQQEKLFKELKYTIDNLREQNEDLKKSVDTMSSKYDEFLFRISTLESERKQDKIIFQQLEEKIENLERKSRCAGIEIRNIPKSSGETKENIADTVKNLGKVLQIDLIGSDIRDVYRINSKDGSNPIIAELSSVIMKEKIITKVKNFNKSKPKKIMAANAIYNLPTPSSQAELLTYQYVNRKLKEANTCKDTLE
ncbi:jg12565 [Pararge aegeria aegeria]|uniref:Jg12565 protein n=1 Tax=Pararge aegeria aegeria TaxID=348720 RepID=A0A8S4S7L9_9NEOP|nr:jg12565 [Pararge aegeria aegeria]